MSLVYITGISGAGKSTVRDELKRRGFVAYGTDEDSLAAFYNNTTGESVGNQVAAEVRTVAWRKEHTWKIPRQLIEKIAGEAKDKPIFLCGVAANDNEFWDLFSHVIALMIDEETLRQRLNERPDNSFGKLDNELQNTLAWQKTAADDYIQLGAVLVDATQPLNSVVDTILDIADAKVG